MCSVTHSGLHDLMVKFWGCKNTATIHLCTDQIQSFIFFCQSVVNVQSKSFKETGYQYQDLFGPGSKTAIFQILKTVQGQDQDHFGQDKDLKKLS